jgi:hypothetical protein
MMPASLQGRRETFPPEQGSAMDADLHIRGAEPVRGQNVIPLG